MSRQPPLLRKVVIVLGISFSCAALAQSSDDGDTAKITRSGGIETARFKDGVVETDITGKGAVLCIWDLYEAARTVGKQCHKGEDVAFQNELDRSLNKTDAFIRKNAPATKADLEGYRAKGLEELRASRNICIGDTEKMYEVFRNQGAEALRKSTDDMLSVPRRPVMNPCL